MSFTDFVLNIQYEVYEEVKERELNIHNRVSYEDLVEEAVENAMSFLDVEEAESYIYNEGMGEALELYHKKHGLDTLGDKDPVRRILELLKVVVMNVIYEGFEEEYEEWCEKYFTK